MSLAPNKRSTLHRSGLHVLGMAQYRTGDYEDAVETLEASVEALGGIPADLAFLAMAKFRLGKTDEARRLLDRLHQAVERPVWQSAAEEAFIREAEAMMAGPSGDSPH
jgi:tetratricopeptide (TPR) repeat protein